MANEFGAQLFSRSAILLRKGWSTIPKGGTIMIRRNWRTVFIVLALAADTLAVFCGTFAALVICHSSGDTPNPNFTLGSLGCSFFLAHPNFLWACPGFVWCSLPQQCRSAISPRIEIPSIFNPRNLRIVLCVPTRAFAEKSHISILHHFAIYFCYRPVSSQPFKSLHAEEGLRNS